jgi:GNAT superfamily N-acetyltransferase
VWHRGDNWVLAYYSLAAHLLQRDELPSTIGRGGPRQIPAVLLARLALDRTLHGEGLGGVLLADALRRVIAATDTVAARFVVVDAIDEHAASFYEHHGFARIPETQRLIAKLSDVATALKA